MAEPEVEAAWRAEFERVGEDGDRGKSELRKPAFRWLGDEAEVQASRGKHAPLPSVDSPSSYCSRDRRPHRFRLDLLALAPASHLA
jgi:hypothetical protein